MALIAEALEARGYRLETFSPQSTAYWVAKLFGGGFSTASGVSVTPDAAMAIGTVYASCRNVAEDLASLPLPIYTEDEQGRKHPDRADPAFAILNRRANPEMSAMSFRETLQGHLMLRGVGFAEKEYDRGARIRALWPLNPARMRTVRNGVNGVVIKGAPDNQLAYIYTLPDGTEKIFAPDMLFKPRGFGPDGIRGYSIVQLAREAMGVALATEGYAARFFANDARPGVVLKHPKELSPKARENLKVSWKESHEGLSNAHRVAILEEGLDIVTVGIPPADAQFLETRKFERTEISMWFRMPPDKLGDLERATWSNMEQSNINYAGSVIGAWANRWDQQLAADEIVDATHLAVHDLRAFYRGDAKTRGEYLHFLRQDGAVSANDMRAYESFPLSTDPAADELLIPLNMVPASAFGTDGMLPHQRARAAYDYLRAGYLAEGVNKLLGLGDLAHSGLMPGKDTPLDETAGDAAGSV